MTLSARLSVCVQELMDVLDQEPALKALKLLGQELSTAATGFDARFVGELVD